MNHSITNQVHYLDKTQAVMVNNIAYYYNINHSSSAGKPQTFNKILQTTVDLEMSGHGQSDSTSLFYSFIIPYFLKVIITDVYL